MAKAKPSSSAAAAKPGAAAAPPATVHSALVTYTSMLSLLSLCPPFVILLWYTMVHADGSVVKTYEHLREHGVVEGLKAIWPMPTVVAWKIIFGFGLFEAVLQLLLPGKRFEGPISPAGNVPVYKVCAVFPANGLQAYAVTLITYLSLWCIEPLKLFPQPYVTTLTNRNICVRFGIFNPAIVYDHLGEIYSALVFGSFVFCIFLYIKGHVAPSSSDSGSSGNVIIDFYWGMELYPRIGKYFDIKVFTNCRFGMMSWAVLAVTYCIKQLALSILLAGILCIYINYDCDRQRQEFRRTNGKCSVWGKAPSKIVASYQTTKGETKTSLLLTSGWWGLSRHFHYVPEILSAFFWTVPALFSHFLPYFYVIFLTILLFDRAKRDDDRCSSK
nr:unnamed protein product [Digitaria exilis]